MEELTLAEVLLERKQTENIGITFIEGSDQEYFLSYGQLWRSAVKVLAALQSRGIEAGDELVIQISKLPEMLCFWPIRIYPGETCSRGSKHIYRRLDLMLMGRRSWGFPC